MTHHEYIAKMERLRDERATLAYQIVGAASALAKFVVGEALTSSGTAAVARNVLAMNARLDLMFQEAFDARNAFDAERQAVT
jgi:hypothetical protein